VQRIKNSLTKELIFMQTIKVTQVTNVLKPLGFYLAYFSSIMTRFLKFTYKYL